MNAKHAISQIIELGDFACLRGGRVLVVELTPELEDYLAAFGSGREDLEDDDPGEDDTPREEEPHRKKVYPVLRNEAPDKRL